MSLRPDHNQIIAAFQSGVSAEDIAEDLGWNILTVKSVIGKHAASINRQLGLGEMDGEGVPVKPIAKKPVFTEDEFNVAKRVIVELATGGEMEGIRLKAAERIIDEFKGRKDLVASLGNGDFNLTVVNNLISKGLDSAAASRNKLKSAKSVQSNEVLELVTVAPGPAPQI